MLTGPFPEFLDDGAALGSSSSIKMTLAFRAIKAAGYDSLGEFLLKLFHNPTYLKKGTMHEHASAVSDFLGRRSLVHADDIMDQMYTSPLCYPHGQTRTPAESMAQHTFFAWAQDTVAGERS